MLSDCRHGDTGRCRGGATRGSAEPLEACGASCVSTRRTEVILRLEFGNIRTHTARCPRMCAYDGLLPPASLSQVYRPCAAAPFRHDTPSVCCVACSALRSFLTVTGRPQKSRLTSLLTALRGDDGPPVLAKWTATANASGTSEPNLVRIYSAYAIVHCALLAYL